MSIRVLNKHRDDCSKGIYIGRGSPLGNPFRLKSAGGEFERDESVAMYEEHLRRLVAERDPAVCAELNRLYRIARDGDLDLVCFCAPLACHGDVVKKILEEKLGTRGESVVES